MLYVYCDEKVVRDFRRMVLKQLFGKPNDTGIESCVLFKLPYPK